MPCGCGKCSSCKARSNIRKIPDYRKSMDRDDYYEMRQYSKDQPTPLRNYAFEQTKKRFSINKMWYSTSRRLYSFLKNKGGTKKERRMASYILSTRRRSR